MTAALVDNSLETLNVLVVDDNQDNVELLMYDLEDSGYKVFTANSGQECLRVAQEAQPDIILLDIMMPGIDGIETLQRLRESEQYKETPVLMLSASDAEETVVRALETGATDFISKPFSYEIVQARMRSALRQRIILDLERKNQSLIEASKRHERMSAVGMLAGGVAHEYNNLNTIIQGNVELLQRIFEGDVNDSVKKVASRLYNINEAVERSQQVTQSLLKFVKPVQQSAESCSVYDVIHSTLEIAKLELRRFSVELEIIEFDHSLNVRGRHGEIGQIFLNLITNACHALEGRDNPRIVVAIQVDEENGNGVICIRDNGRGMTQEHRAEIFKPFFSTKGEHASLQSAWQPNIKGTGLGLSVCESIVAHYDGCIEVSSEINVGTEFRVSLPLIQTVRINASHDVPELDVDVVGKEILVVDDEEHLRTLISDILCDEGCMPREAKDGHQALELLKKNNFDLIILDWHMANMGGEHFLVHCHEENVELPPVLVVSGWQDSSHFTQHPQVTDWLHKPFKSDEILQKVAAVLAV